MALRGLEGYSLYLVGFGCGFIMWNNGKDLVKNLRMCLFKLVRLFLIAIGFFCEVARGNRNREGKQNETRRNSEDGIP